MTTIHKKLKKYAIKEGVNIKDWNKELPHFGMGSPHRYQGLAKNYIKTSSSQKVCVYCLKPENLK